MKRASTKKPNKAKSKGSEISDLKPAKADQVKGGATFVVNTTRYDPYKAAKFR